MCWCVETKLHLVLLAFAICYMPLTNAIFLVISVVKVHGDIQYSFIHV